MCIFCKIVNKEIPNYTLYEDDLILAFLDISQVTRGHTLIIPKVHCDTFLTCPPETLAHLSVKAQELAKHIEKQTGCKGMNILTNVNEVAGQSVHHFHLHLIPRYDSNDALELKFHPSDEQDFTTLVEQLSFK
ncbi:MAG: HIT family protein [Erysipelotrichaceae bacterium]